jgi:hypothetical protein
MTDVIWEPLLDGSHVAERAASRYYVVESSEGFIAEEMLLQGDGRGCDAATIGAFPMIDAAKRACEKFDATHREERIDRWLAGAEE